MANAGITKDLPFEAITENDFDYIVDINFKGTFFTVQLAINALNDNASIILTSSIAARYGVAAHSPIYGPSKAAVIAMAQSFAAILISRGIRVNTISPGYTYTNLFEKAGYTQ